MTALTDLMTKVSLTLNLLVLAPVCAGLLRASPWTLLAFGPATPARGILLSVYLAIAAASMLLLLEPVLTPVWTFLVHGERPHAWTICGGALALSGSVANAFFASRRNTQA